MFTPYKAAWLKKIDDFYLRAYPVERYAAGLAVGYWADPEDLRANWQEDRRWSPQWNDDQRAKGYAGWKKAVERTLNWVEV